MHDVILLNHVIFDFLALDCLCANILLSNQIESSLFQAVVVVTLITDTQSNRCYTEEIHKISMSNIY